MLDFKLYLASLVVGFNDYANVMFALAVIYMVRNYYFENGAATVTEEPERSQTKMNARPSRGGFFIKAESWAHVKNKLITREDPYLLHKITGILSIVSFFIRYGVIYPTSGTLGFEEISSFNVGTACIHMGPALTSIIFHVPSTRIAAKPMVIYEEYRLHAILFSFRCFAVYLFAILYPFESYRWAVQALMICVIHLTVDWVTANYGTKGMTAVRAENAKHKQTLVSVAIKRSYSFYQFLALGSHLLPHAHLADLAFNGNVAIQSSAFFMTLYRKGIIRGRAHFVAYTLCLILSSFHIVRLCGTKFAFVVAMGFYSRVQFGCPKYLIWAVFTLIFSPLFVSYRKTVDIEIEYENSFWYCLLVLPLCSILVYSYKTVFANPPPSSSINEKK